LPTKLVECSQAQEAEIDFDAVLSFYDESSGRMTQKTSRNHIRLPNKRWLPKVLFVERQVLEDFFASSLIGSDPIGRFLDLPCQTTIETLR